MDFDQLETFLEVARHLSFSRAAERRFRTQPAISAQIRSIEEEVGARLLDRTGGKVSITAAGKIFLGYVESALEARRAAIRAVAEADRVPGGEIVVAANEGSCLHILPEVFAEFKRSYPDVGITVKRSETREVLEAVIDNSVDFGVAALPVTDKRITVVPIHKDELIVIAPTGHVLAKYKEIKVAQIADYPLLLPKMGRTRDSIDHLFDERNMKPNVSMELDSSELLKRFVSAGVGIGFCAHSTALGDLRLGITAIIKLADAQIRRDMALVFRKDKALSRAALAFIDIAVRLKSPQTAHK
jgi:LysR family transcriptional regulator, low CO2-responsive transcriptional regulator